MKRLVQTFLLAGMAVTIMGASAFAAPINIKFGHSGSMEHQYHIGAEDFKKRVEEKSGGELQVTIFPQGQLGGERDLGEGIRMGTVEMGSASPGNMSGFVPELELFGIPFIFKTDAQVYAVLDGDVGRQLDEAMEKKGFVNLAWWEVGFRNMTNNVRSVVKPEDMKGLKIRVQESKIKIELLRRLGAIPTPIPFGELYTALQQKVTDGQENPIATIHSILFYEVQKHITMTRHTYEPALVICNPRWFNGLSEKHQALLREAAKETATWQRARLAELEELRLKEILAAGCEVVEQPDLEAFAKATEGMYDIVKDQVPLELYNATLEAVKQVQ